MTTVSSFPTKMTLVCARSLRETLVVVLVLESKSSPFNIRLMIDCIQRFFFLTLAVLRSTQKVYSQPQISCASGHVSDKVDTN